MLKDIVILIGALNYVYINDTACATSSLKKTLGNLTCINVVVVGISHHDLNKLVSGQQKSRPG